MSDILDDARDDLRSPDPTVREKAVDRLGNSDDPSAFGLIAGLAKDPDEAVRGTVACNLGSVENAHSIPILLELAEYDPSNEVKAEAIAPWDIFMISGY